MNTGSQIKGGDTITADGQTLKKNITVKKVGKGDNEALEVSLKPDLTVDSVTTNKLEVGPVIINQDGINAGNTTIKNVAPGKNGTDAVNVDRLNQKFGDVNSSVNKVDNNARAGVAQALATAGLPQAYLPGKSMLAIGGGHYRGETGYAVGSLASPMVVTGSSKVLLPATHVVTSVLPQQLVTNGNLTFRRPEKAV